MPGKQKTLTPCEHCGLVLGAREKRSHKCSGSGHQKTLVRCEGCGMVLGARELRAHKCPKQFAKPIGRPRESPILPPAPASYEVVGKLRAIPGSPAALAEEAFFRTKEERRQLVEFISTWRSSQGKPNSSRTLSARSLAQLRKMKEQIESGNTYRAGRRWKQS
jgi:hypothetical protein